MLSIISRSCGVAVGSLASYKQCLSSDVWLFHTHSPGCSPLFTTATLSSLSYTHTHMQTHAHTDACVHACIPCLTLYKRHKVCWPVWVAQLTRPVTVWEEERLLEYMLNLLFWLFCRITYIELSRISSDRWSNQKLEFFSLKDRLL